MEERSSNQECVGALALPLYPASPYPKLKDRLCGAEFSTRCVVLIASGATSIPSDEYDGGTIGLRVVDCVLLRNCGSRAGLKVAGISCTAFSSFRLKKNGND